MPPAKPDAAPAPVPLIVLTGFLGSGKTTVLNRVLGAQHHRRVAVLVNELGRIDIDAGLIRARAGDVLELTGGCVCHQIGVQRELWSALADIVGRSRPDVVVLETTGIAEPAAILRGLDRLARPAASQEPSRDTSQDASEDASQNAWGDWSNDPRDEMPAPVRVAGVVTVVDAEAGARQLEKHEEARDQVTAADRILISKIDIAPAEHLAELHRRLRELNPGAERAAFPAGGAGTSALVPWLLDARAATDRTTGRTRTPAGRHSNSHEQPPADAQGHRHAHQLAAATYVDDAPLIKEALLLVCQGLGDSLVRAKGFVSLAGEARRGFLERAGDRTTLELGTPWGNEPAMTRLVLIGEDLDEAALHRQLWACRAGRAEIV